MSIFLDAFLYNIYIFYLFREFLGIVNSVAMDVKLQEIPRRMILFHSSGF